MEERARYSISHCVLCGCRTRYYVNPSYKLWTSELILLTKDGKILSNVSAAPDVELLSKHWYVHPSSMIAIHEETNQKAIVFHSRCYGVWQQHFKNPLVSAEFLFSSSLYKFVKKPKNNKFVDFGTRVEFKYGRNLKTYFCSCNIWTYVLPKLDIYRYTVTEASQLRYNYTRRALEMSMTARNNNLGSVIEILTTQHGCSLLSARDILNCACVSRSWYVSMSSRFIWQALLLQEIHQGQQVLDILNAYVHPNLTDWKNLYDDLIVKPKFALLNFLRISMLAKQYHVIFHQQQFSSF